MNWMLTGSLLARREDARDTINAQRQREAKLHEQVRMAEENEAAMADELKVTTNHSRRRFQHFTRLRRLLVALRSRLFST